MRLSDLLETRSVETDGEWVDFAAGVRLRVRPLGCEAYDNFIAEHAVPGPDGSLSFDDRSDLQKRALAETIVVDWRGVTDDEGLAVPFSKAVALDAFRASYPFVKQVLAIAGDLRRREDARWKAVEGKSAPTGSGGAESATV